MAAATISTTIKVNIAPIIGHLKFSQTIYRRDFRGEVNHRNESGGRLEEGGRKRREGERGREKSRE